MDLAKIPDEELLEELDKRTRAADTSDKSILVVGTICDHLDGPSVELFCKAEKPSDLPTQFDRLRARYNSHRNYRLFYFKTDQFDQLKSQLDNDLRKFSRWVIDCPSIKMEQI